MRGNARQPPGRKNVWTVWHRVQDGEPRRGFTPSDVRHVVPTVAQRIRYESECLHQMTCVISVTGLAGNNQTHVLRLVVADRWCLGIPGIEVRHSNHGFMSVATVSSVPSLDLKSTV